MSQLYPITIHGQTFSLTKEECANLRQQLWDNYSRPLMVEMVCNNDPALFGRSIMGMQSELPIPHAVVLPQPQPTPLRTAADQPMPDHLEPAERDEIDRLLLTVFQQDTDAIHFLTAHNSGLRAKPLDLIQRDRQGVQAVLHYLRQAAGNENNNRTPATG